jgi:DNA-directed RNA polymerase subunit M/transcription elongation factor TFIIS
MNSLKSSNRQLLDKYITKCSESLGIEKHLIEYEIDYILYTNVSKKDAIKLCIQRLYNNQFFWNDPVYQSFRDEDKEENDFFEHPCEVEEGVLQCFKCKSFKTLSYQRQTRSADEGATTFIQCVECGNKWRNAN